MLDGRVLVCGGRLSDDDDALDSAEIYDPVLNTWTVAAPMGNWRRDHSQSTMLDGRVLMCGGCGKNFSSFGTTEILETAEMYDPTMNTWVDAKPMLDPHSDHSQSTLRDGRILVVADGSPVERESVAAIFSDLSRAALSLPITNLPTIPDTNTLRQHQN